METISKLMEFIQQQCVVRAVLTAASGWLILNLICWIAGAFGLLALGKRQQLKQRVPACLPGGQIWYTVKLAGHERAALWVEHLIWWCPGLIVGAVAAVIWAAAEYLNRGGTLVFWLLGLAALLLLAALVSYVAVRVLEFRALFVVFQYIPAWILALLGTLAFVPLQRLMLFLGREAYLAEDEEE